MSSRFKLAAAILLAAGTAASAQSLTTGFSGSMTFLSGANSGNFFNITALDPSGITINSWDTHSQASAGTPITVEVWVRPAGPYQGFETNAGEWVMLGSIGTVAAGHELPTPVAIGDLFIPSGQTYGIRINYVNGGARYNLAASTIEFHSNADAQIQLGAAQSGLFTGSPLEPRGWNGTIYYDIGNTVVSGACCLPDGSCVDQTESMCNGAGGTFQGAGTECATVPPCPQPATGACCLLDGTCVIEWEGGCLALGGEYHGDGTDCSSITCPFGIYTNMTQGTTNTSADIGAYVNFTALDPAGVVIEGFDIDTPAAVGTSMTVHVYAKPGEFFGYETDPSAWTQIAQVQTTAAGLGNRTPVPLMSGFHVGSGETWALRIGAANGGIRYSTNAQTMHFHTTPHAELEMGRVQTALFSGSLFGSYPSDRRGWNGILWYTVGATVVSGACCLPDGTCNELREAVCTGQGGIYHGDGTTCATIPPCPVGACCFDDGTCDVIAEAGCLSMGGTFQGVGTDCTTPCPQPGACCLPNGGCSEVGPIACASLGGNFSGHGTDCATICPPPTDKMVPPNFSAQATAWAYTPDYTQTLAGGFNAQAIRLVATADPTTPGAWQNDAQMMLQAPSGAIFNIGRNAPISWTDPNHLASGSPPAGSSAAGQIDVIYHYNFGPVDGTWSVNFMNTWSTGTINWNNIEIIPIQLVTGACCFADGSCDEVLESLCVSAGGTYHGDNSTCAGIPPCPQPGACCLANGGCVIESENRCVAFGGTYNGDGTSCGAGNCWSAPILWDNGSMVTHVGQGSGGADASELPAGANAIGENASLTAGVRLAEDFEIPSGETWTLTRFTTYAYQTGAPSTGTITDLVLQIWDGNPSDPGSSVIWGDLTTNVRDPNLSGFADIYRVTTTTGLLNTDRAVQKVVAVLPDIQLSGGTYWVEWSTVGSTASGPFIPPVTVLGDIPLGNAMIWRNAPWAPVVDELWNTGQYPGGQPMGLPFILEGSVGGGCYADCDMNGILNIDDFLCFINEFSQQTPYSDCDNNGVHNIDDFMCFINEFAQGCP